MKIFGIGCDIVQNQRIKNIINKTMINRFLEKVLHQSERIEFEDKVSDAIRVQYIASRWAVKQAANKAVGRREFNFSQMRLVKDRNGKPFLKFDQGENTQLLAELGIERIHISLAHQDDYAIGYAVAMINEQGQQNSGSKIQ